MRFNFTKKSESVPEEDYFNLTDLAYNGFTIERVGEETPMAWDAGWDIEGQNSRELVISGGAGCGGFGSVVIRLPLEVEIPYWIEFDLRDDIEKGERDWAIKTMEDLGYKAQRPKPKKLTIKFHGCSQTFELKAMTDEDIDHTLALAETFSGRKMPVDDLHTGYAMFTIFEDGEEIAGG